MFHCFRRGCDNICSMTKDTYIIRKDPKTGLRYVTKVIEEMKNNHRECGKENIASIMPQTPGMCNRLSCNTIWKVFYMCTEKYLISILMWNLFFHSGSPLCLVKVLSCKSVHYTQNLTVFGSVSWFPSWTACSLVFQSTIWFKTLITFMSDLSRRRDLDQIYTNHSIRATGPTLLSKETMVHLRPWL